MAIINSYRRFFAVFRNSHSEITHSVFCGKLAKSTPSKRGFLLLILLILPLLVNAQPSGFAGSFSRLGFGPRGMGMGNANIASTDEGIYSYYNPALAAYSKSGSQVDFSTSFMSFDRTLNSLNGTFRLPPSAGLNISLLNANVTDIDGRTTSGYYTSELATHEYQLLTAFGINIHKKVAAGIGVKFNLADFHSDISNAQGVGFDIGVLYKVKETISLGITARDLLASYSWNSGAMYGDESLGESVEKFPAILSIGGTYQIQPEILFALSYGWLVHEDQHFQQLKLGGSWMVHERISLRSGWQIDDLENIETSNRPSAGFSVHLPFDILKPSIDYAFLIEPNQISSMHVFGLRLNL